ncbi:MAG: rod shape-determining protein MreC [Cyanobacteria bacterium NC_groundwater_1444_Ag_S-0.65um_54_12]|nr:rod shape-determining protein MreC [Cyanobacteria bacterium NC_groundwater_1444_Ag_S-0.65um_54_12]
MTALVLVAGLTSWTNGRSILLPELLRPVWLGIQAIFSTFRGGAGYFQDLTRLQQDNKQFKLRLAEIEYELIRRTEAAAEVDRLRALLDLANSLPTKGRFARVIGRSPDNWHARIYLDKGRKEGVASDAVVLVPSGVVGRVSKSGDRISEVSLLTDPGNQVSFVDQRSRSPGVLVGEGGAMLTMRYLQQQVDFRIGDSLVTSGYGNIYPKGLLLGKVARVIRQPDAITPQVSVAPQADLDRLEEVLVLDPLSELP